MPTTSVFNNNNAVRFPIAELLSNRTGVNYSGLKPDFNGTLYGCTSLCGKTDALVEKIDANGRINKFIHYYHQRRLPSSVILGTASLEGVSNVPCQTPSPRTTLQRDAISTISFTDNVALSYNDYRILNDILTAAVSAGGVLPTTILRDDRGFLASQQRIVESIRSTMYALHRRMNQYLVDQIYLNFGSGLPLNAAPVNYNITAPSYTFINAPDRQWDFVNGLGQFLADMRNSEFYGKPIICGMGNFMRFDAGLQVTELQDTGINFGLVRNRAEYTFYPDTYIGDTQPNQCIFAYPGSLMLSFANQYTGDFEQMIGNEIYTRLQDPILSSFAGRPIYADMKIRNITCSDGGGASENNPQMLIIITYHFGVSFLPTDIFQAGDRLLPFAGVPATGLGRFTAVAA